MEEQNGIAKMIGERFYMFEKRLRAVERRVNEPIIVTDDSEYLMKENEALRAALEDEKKKSETMQSVIASIRSVLNHGRMTEIIGDEDGIN